MQTPAAAGPNAEQVAFWNQQAGPKWVAYERMLDEQIAPIGLAGMDRARVAPGENVLDVGCGCGQTTLQLAQRVGASGSVTGVDISRADARPRARARRASRVCATCGSFRPTRRKPSSASTPSISSSAASA